MDVVDLKAIPYKLKRHPRAKYVRLRASALRGIEITVPMRFDERLIPEVLERNQAWLQKQLAKLPALDAEELPQQVSILGEPWKIEYVHSTARLMVFTVDRRLVLIGKIQNKLACRKKLIAWAKEQARLYLTEQLLQASRETKLEFSEVTVRAQQTLWGSCTRSNSISLNYRLLFFPLSVMRYVIIHELCHTVHRNHSEKFWKLVARHDPEYQQHRKELKNAAHYIPAWAL